MLPRVSCFPSSEQVVYWYLHLSLSVDLGIDLPAVVSTYDLLKRCRKIMNHTILSYLQLFGCVLSVCDSFPEEVTFAFQIWYSVCPPSPVISAGSHGNTLAADSIANAVSPFNYYVMKSIFFKKHCHPTYTWRKLVLSI